MTLDTTAEGLRLGFQEIRETGLERAIRQHEEELARSTSEWIEGYGKRMSRRTFQKEKGERLTDTELKQSIIDQGDLARIILSAPEAGPIDMTIGQGLNKVMVALQKRLISTMNYENQSAAWVAQSEIRGVMGLVVGLDLLNAAFANLPEGVKVEISSVYEDKSCVTDIRVGEARVQVKSVNGMDRVVDFGRIPNNPNDISDGIGVPTKNGREFRVVISGKDIKRMKEGIRRTGGDPEVDGYYMILPGVDDSRYFNTSRWYRGQMLPSAKRRAVEIISDATEKTSFYKVVEKESHGQKRR